MTTTTLSIVGGGATGIAVVVSLLKELKKLKTIPSLKIYLFEPNELGEGLAYSVKAHQLLLNTSIASTSLLANNKLHFFQWLKQNEILWRPLFPEIKDYNLESFMPRALCALYIKNTLQQALADIDSFTVKFSHIKEKVIDIQMGEKPKKLYLYTQNKKYISHFCVLCTGYGNGQTQSYQSLKKHPRYFPSPYFHTNEIIKIPKDATILIIGTKQTAIDTALLLNHHTHITMASKSGRLPAVKNRLVTQKPSHLTRFHQELFFAKHQHHLTLEEVKQEIEKELYFRYKKNIYLDAIPLKKNGAAQLKEDIKLAKMHHIYWEDTIMSIIEFINNAWHYLSTDDKNHLMKNEIKIIKRYISAFPLHNAEIICKMLDKKNLQIKKRISRVTIHKNKFLVEFSRKNDAVKLYDYAINAGGAEKHLAKETEALFVNLIKNKLITINDFGGIKVNDDLQIKTKKTKQRIYAAGPLVKGSVLITNFLISCADHARIVAKSIVANIAKT